MGMRHAPLKRPTSDIKSTPYGSASGPLHPRDSRARRITVLAARTIILPCSYIKAGSQTIASLYFFGEVAGPGRAFTRNLQRDRHRAVFARGRFRALDGSASR